MGSIEGIAVGCGLFYGLGTGFTEGGDIPGQAP